MSDYIVIEYSEELTRKNGSFGNGPSIGRPVVGSNSDNTPYQSLDSATYQRNEANMAKDKEDKEDDSEEVVFEESEDDHDHSAELEYAEEAVHLDPEEGLSESGMEAVVLEGDAEEVLGELGKRIPGVEIMLVDEDDDEDEKETDWENDKDPQHFIAYISSAYPGGIPKHDGTSTLGCEAAMNYLKKLDKEISMALRADIDGVLKPHLKELEDIRINLNNDINMLSDHAKELRKKRNKKKADQEDLDMVKEAELSKTASTPKIQVVVTAFERAIAGIITNASISSGKPPETVFEFLKKKYSLDEREELSILQILKDMGHPIFKDRGTLGKSKDSKEEGAQGVEFIKNYFA